MRDQPDEWRNLVMPALHTGLATDLLHLSIGEALWPAWQPVKDSESIRTKAKVTMTTEAAPY
jgi:hypothetical protein